MPSDLVSGSAVFYDARVKLVKVEEADH